MAKQTEISNKTILAAIGSLALGVVGSAVYDLFVKPGSHWFARAALTIITLGSATLRDSVYREAARGNQQLAATYLLLLLTAMILYAPYYFFRRVRDLNRSLDRLKKEVLTTQKAADAKPKDAKDFFDEAARNMRKLHWLVACLPLLSSVLLVQQVKSLLAIEFLTRFQQDLAICRPYLGDREITMYESRFAQVRSRQAYVQVITELRQIADQHHVSLPD